MYAGLSLDKYNYFVSEGDGFVEACGNLYGRRGLSVDVQFYTSSRSAQGIFWWIDIVLTKFLFAE